MASIHIRELQQYLAEGGQRDALPGSPDGFFLQVRFDDPDHPTGQVDPDFQDQVLTADCPFGHVTIQFDRDGQLQSIDLS